MRGRLKPDTHFQPCTTYCVMLGKVAFPLCASIASPVKLGL